MFINKRFNIFQQTQQRILFMLMIKRTAFMPLKSKYLKNTFQFNASRHAVLGGIVLTIVSAFATADALAFSNSPERQEAADESTALEVLSPSIRHVRTAEEILSKLQRRHYQKRAFNDELSSDLYDNYLKRLDPSKSYFTKTDLADFEQYRLILDDGIRRGNLNPSFTIFNRYREKIVSQLDQLVNHLPERIAALDFTLEESIELESETLDWAANDAELKDRARKSLKNSVLGLMLADKDADAIIETLGKRYKNQLNRITQLNAEDVFQLYINSLTELYDPHTNYLSPRTSENFSINMRLSLEGIGAVLRRDGEHTVVERLIPAGPADKQGELKPADKIISVGQGDESEPVDVIGWRLDEVVGLIRGKKDTTVILEVLSEVSPNPDESKLIQIVRNTVKLEEQAAQQSVLDIYHGEELHKLGVITIPTFYIDFDASRNGDADYKSTTRDVRKLITELEEQDVEGIIIDLRGNGGGSLQEVNQLTGLFVERGPVVQIRGSNGRISPSSNYPNPGYYKKPIAVLIDRLSASASEIFAGAIQDYERGLIVGSQSFGKGTVQQLADLSHGSLKLTEAKFYRISGGSTQHRGVIPDIVLPSLYDNQEIGEDTLDFALQWDTVEAIRHKDYGDFDAIETTLYSLHKDRIADDPDYRFLTEQIELNNKYANITSLSLNESKRRALIDEDSKARNDIENVHRASKGLPPKPLKKSTDSEEAKDDVVGDDVAANDSDVDKEPTDMDSNENEANKGDKEDEKEVDPRTDFLLTETGHILLDAIKLTQTPNNTATAANKPLAASSKH